MTREEAILRERAILVLREKGKTLQEIGDIFGITRERIRQILIAARGDSKFRAFATRKEASRILGCSVGKVITMVERGELPWIWLGAHRIYPIKGLLKANFKPHRAAQTTFYCDTCGKEKTIQESDYKRHKLHFCDRKCLGRWVGTHYGWGK